MIIKTGDQINVAENGGLTGKVVGVNVGNSKAVTEYIVEVEGYEENFIIPDYMVAKYGVGQGVMFLASTKTKSWYKSQGEIKEVKYNETTNKVEYAIRHRVFGRFSSMPTPRVAVVPEDRVLESTEYKPFEDIWMCD